MKNLFLTIIVAFVWLGSLVGSCADSGINKEWGENSLLLNSAYVYTNVGASYWVTNYVPTSSSTTKTNVTVFTTNDTKYVIVMKPLKSGYFPAGKIPYSDLVKLYTTSNLVSVVTGYWKSVWSWDTSNPQTTQIVWNSGSTVSITNIYKATPERKWTDHSYWAEYTTNLYPVDCLNVSMVDQEPSLMTLLVAKETGLSGEVKRVQNVILVTVSNIRNNIELELTNQVTSITNSLLAGLSDANLRITNLLASGSALGMSAAASNTSRAAAGSCTNNLCGFCTNSADNVLNIISTKASKFTFVLTNLEWHVEGIANCLTFLAIGATNAFEIWTNPDAVDSTVKITLHNTQAAYGGNNMSSNRYLHTFVYYPAGMMAYDVNVITNSQSGK